MTDKQQTDMKQTLIKITNDHYVVVDDSEIKEGDCMYLQQGNTPSTKQGQIARCEFADANNLGVTWKKITHSTPNVGGFSALLIAGIKELSLSEVKELIGEVDVEKKGAELAYSRRIRFGDDFNSGVCYGLEEGYVIGYNQAIEDNKEKKYTEEDMRLIFASGYLDGVNKRHYSKDMEDTTMDYFQPKAEWEVTFDEQGKLRLV